DADSCKRFKNRSRRGREEERKYGFQEKSRKPIPVATHLTQPTFKWGIAI
ncbi:unnamed protein product, partial [marine sediment metagenome]